MSVPDLPIHQDCHELWSKKRRRQMRENAENAASNQQMISASRGGSIPSLPGSEKLEDNSQRYVLTLISAKDLCLLTALCLLFSVPVDIKEDLPANLPPGRSPLPRQPLW